MSRITEKNKSFKLANGVRAVNLYEVVHQEVELGVSALRANKGVMAVTFFQSALKKLSARQPFYDHLVHNLLLAYKLLVEDHFKNGDAASAHLLLRPALGLEIKGKMSGDREFRRQFASAFQDLGLVFFRHKQYAESVACFRRSIAICPAAGWHVNLTNALAASGQRAELVDYLSAPDEQRPGTHIFIACVPKSASTFLKNLLVRLTGFKDVFMVYAAGQNEHDLYLPTLRETFHLDTVTQQHARASDANIRLMQAFEIRPVVLVRNIYDAMISLRDFYANGAYLTSYFKEDFVSLDEEKRIDLLIDNLVPWYFQFVASWSRAEKRGSVDLCWLGYEELIADKPAAVEKILAFYGFAAPRRAVEQSITEIESENRKIRFNKGVSGRGEVVLNARQKKRIKNFAKYFPSVNFSRIGL